MIDILAGQLKALGHPQRLRLFELIRSGCHCCYVNSGEDTVGLGSRVGDLAGEFELAPSTISHHLKELKTAGLVEVERRGQFLFCRVREEALQRIIDYLRSASAGIEFRPSIPIEERKR
jgi:ArsR family transcriptional regulator